MITLYVIRIVRITYQSRIRMGITRSSREGGFMTREKLSLRIGAVCMIAGSVAVFGFRSAHGDLPTDTGEAALAYVASHPIYPLVHLGNWLGVLVWAGGLVALSGSLTYRAAWAIGRLGAASALVGAAVHIVDFSIDGYALPTLADTWAAASSSHRADLEFGARLALVIIGGPSTSALVILWGSTLILYGLAVKMEGYSIWLGWTGVVLGAAIFALGTIQFLEPNIFPGVLFYGGGTWVSQMWTVALGVAMWRRARAPAHTAADARHTDRDGS
jgi:hypothetical protein